LELLKTKRMSCTTRQQNFLRTRAGYIWELKDASLENWAVSTGSWHLQRSMILGKVLEGISRYYLLRHHTTNQNHKNTIKLMEEVLILLVGLVLAEGLLLV
jgi:hypothetical protein